MQNLTETIQEVVQAVAPIAFVIFVLQFTIIWLPWTSFVQFLIGLVMVTLGLILFLLGVHVGLLPIGELIGAALPKTGKVWLVVLFSFILGFATTVAEPDVRVLATQVDTVSGGDISRMTLVYAVAIGLGFFVALAML